MKTRLEMSRDGRAARIYHLTDGGAYAWTHPVEERPECEACQSGVVPKKLKTKRRKK